MTKAIIYLRSATGNSAQVDAQRRSCRDYLAERDLHDAGVVTDNGHPAPGLPALLDAAASTGATEVVVSDLSRLGRRPLVNMRNFDALEEAGLTIHVADGTMSGPVLDECIRDMMYEFAAADAPRIHGDDETDKDDPASD